MRASSLCLELLVLLHVVISPSAKRVHTHAVELVRDASNASDEIPWFSGEPVAKTWDLKEAHKACPWGTEFLITKMTDRMLNRYQDTGEGMLNRMWGAILPKFTRDQRVENMESTWADKFTVAFYSVALHLSLRSYNVRHQDSVPVPTAVGKRDLFEVGHVVVPFMDMDNVEASSFMNTVTNCIMDILREMPFEDWLEDSKEHSNNWEFISSVGNKLSRFSNKKEWLQHYYKFYTMGSGEPAFPAEQINLRQHFFKNDEWDDKMEKVIAFDMMGAHRVEPVSREFGGETLRWALKLNSFAKIEVRPLFSKYGADMYFTEDGMPALVMTPDGVEVARGSKDWQYWKFVWRSTLVGSVTLVDHLHGSHFRGANNLARAARSTLSPDHPFRRLLTIFTFGTIDVNIGAMHTLVGPNHALHRTTPFKNFMHLSDAVPESLPDPLVAHRHFLNDADWERLPPMLQRTPYYQDGRELFKAIERLIHRYTTLVPDMCDENGVLVDPEIIAFRDKGADLNAEGLYSGMTRDVDSCKTIVDRMVTAVWTVTGWHRHVGRVIEYVDPDVAAFSWKEGEGFGRPKQYMIVSVIGATTAKTQPKLSEDYTHVFKGMEKEDEAVQMWRDFQEDLKLVKAKVAENNEAREYPNFDADPDVVECSIAV